MSKRTKITFERINRDNYTIIDPRDIAQVNKQIKMAMTPIIKEFKKKQFESWVQAGKNPKG